ncbi:selenophosphate synthetase [compost metagenome]
MGAQVSAPLQALLTDPQTSGGLLVSCTPETVDQVLALFAAQGFASAAVIGRMEAGAVHTGAEHTGAVHTGAAQVVVD